MISRLAAILFLCLLPAMAPAQKDGELPTLPFTSLSDQNISQMGKAALAIKPERWKHAETENFIYHYFDNFIAAPVSVEAEYYYRVVAKDLQKDTSRWERKCHIFIFQENEDWKTFQAAAELDPWTGGIHRRNELFILRDREYKWKGNTLGHEVVHLVVDRFFGANVPLWLNEGYAEYVSAKAYAAYHRARGYRSKPRSSSVSPELYIPVEKLTSAVEYPADPALVKTFYNESERLVRMLSAASPQGFLQMFDALAKGALFETALRTGFGNRYYAAGTLDQEFRPYASKNFEAED